MSFPTLEEAPAPLEQIFQRVELESELRALRASESNDRESLHEKVANVATARRGKQKRRGSIAISRIGQATDDVHSKEGVPSSPNALVFAHNSPMYQAQLANLSNSSIASGASQFSNEHAHTEDDNHVTQMHHIAGKKSFSSKIIPRLSRSNSTSVMPAWTAKTMESTVMIGVSVQEATVESTREAADGDGDIINHSRRASVVAHRPLHKQNSHASLVLPRLPDANWLSRVKSFTQKSFAQKFKRKN